jgi:hypothetical protein
MAIYPTEYKIYNIAGKQRQLKPSGFPKKESANQKNQRKEREKKKKRPIPRNEWVIMRGLCSLPGHRGADHS